MHKSFLVFFVSIFSFTLVQAQPFSQKYNYLSHPDFAENGLFLFHIKTQAPVHHGFTLELIGRKRISGYITLGSYSAEYTKLIVGLIPDTEENSGAKKLIEERIEPGNVFEIGSNFYFNRPRSMYAGISIQFQEFNVSATPYELVDPEGRYNLGGDSIGSDEIEDLTDNPNADFFYRSTIIEPTFNPIQLGFTLGKSFHFRKAPRISVSTELGYLYNLKTKTTITSPSFIGQAIVSQLVDPGVSLGSDATLNDFNLPTFTIKLSYAFRER